MKVIFMGTPLFAIPILEKIKTVHEIVLIVTKMDTYDLKKKEVRMSEVKKWALENNIEVFQPKKIKEEYEKIISTPCDVIVTAAYGQIIPKIILDYPKYKCINVHGSILPKYRGGAPIQRAIINGDKETGITIMYMGEKMDNGDIIKIEKLNISDDDTSDSLFMKLSVLGSNLINDVLDDIEKGSVVRVKQNESEVTYAYNLTKEDEKLDFSKDARSVFNQIRGLSLNPGAYFQIEGNLFKVFESEISSVKTAKESGVICFVTKDTFGVSCANGSVIEFKNIKPESKKLMPVRDYLNGKGKNIIKENVKIN